MKNFLIFVFLFFLNSWSVPCWAQQTTAPSENRMAMKEFVRSCTYGVLAGTLVGAATLAFTEQPGENLNKVARGASLGLYAGILLGLYVVYIVPNQMQKDLYEPLPVEEEASLKWQAFPLVSELGLEGAAAGVQLTF